MSTRSRILTACAIIVLLPVFFIPVWKISLTAPQYPEGLGLYIWMRNITGQEPYDLQKINNLNHYIGMKAIVPEEIPELTIMPAVLLGLAVIGMGAAITGRKALLKAWLLGFVLFGIVGFTDFYLWAYDYGHNLHPEAPIKVPGMSYQPPIFGTKKLLNFSASSFPTTGAFLAAGSFILGSLALALKPKGGSDGQ